MMSCSCIFRRQYTIMSPSMVRPVRNAPMKKKVPNRLLIQYGASDMMRSKPIKLNK